jgi:uncharacterized protein (TIGR02453 family)
MLAPTWNPEATMPAFPTLIDDATRFLADLSANNNRDWWQAHKDTYDTRLKGPALALLDHLSGPLGALADAPIKTKLFRPHRDVRFSRDKTPYTTHLHMMWQVDSDAPQNPVFFFGIGLDYVTVGAGIMEFDKPVLGNWRKMLDLDTDRILALTGTVAAQGFTFWEPALKRVPPPYPADHPAATFLRMKGCVASRPLTLHDGLAKDILAAFRDIWPLNALLIQIAEA